MKSIPAHFITLFLLVTSGCGKHSEDARLDLTSNRSSDILITPRKMSERVTLLKDLLESGLPLKLYSRAEKLSFFQAITPAVVETMMETEAERKIIFEYRTSLKAGKISPAIQKKFETISERYKAKDVDELLTRVDVLPLDMLFTQASIESQWGKSPVARDCNNIFGVHAATEAQKCPGHPILTYYPDFTGSIKRYQLLLNSGGAFKNFRKIRAKLRAETGPTGALDSNQLAEGLLPYSERGEAYINDVRNGMKQSGLDEVYRAFIEKSY